MKAFKDNRKVLFVLIIVLLGLSVVLCGCKKKETNQEQGAQNFYEMAERDDQRLRAEPVIKQQAEETGQQTEQQANEAGQQGSEQAKPEFKELSEIEEVEAERLFEVAIQYRKMGRLPGVGYGQMVDMCRQLIEKFPGSKYEFEAKRMLADIPESERKKYNITEEEIDLGNLQ